MLLEEPFDAPQFNLDGYVFRGQVHAIGVVDAVMYPGTGAFQRFDRPSRLAERVQERALDVATRFLEAVGFDHGFFNMEFFYDLATDALEGDRIQPAPGVAVVPICTAVSTASMRMPARWRWRTAAIRRPPCAARPARAPPRASCSAASSASGCPRRRRRGGCARSTGAFPTPGCRRCPSRAAAWRATSNGWAATAMACFTWAVPTRSICTSATGAPARCSAGRRPKRARLHVHLPTMPVARVLPHIAGVPT